MGGMSTTENLPIVYFLGANNVEKSAMAEAITNARHGHFLRHTLQAPTAKRVFPETRIV